jgi:uncharacterized protein YgiM (DUF1202 family)
MSNKILSMMKMSAVFFLLALLMACGATPETAPATEIPVEDAVAQTIAALDAVALQVEQTVAAQVAALEPTVEAPAELPAGGDLADPNANIPVSQPVVDPNLAGGTPQLRVTASSVNVRSGPGVNYPPITTLRQDAVVVVAAKNQTGSWFLIELPGGVKGWISNTVTTPVAEVDMVKVAVAATIPAPPVATAVPATVTTAVTPTSTSTATATTTGVASPTPTATTSSATLTPTATATATMPPTPTATQPPIVLSVILNVQNNSGIEICFLFIDLSSDPWTNDRLGPTETILPGGQVSLSFPTGQYDFMARDCNDNLIDDLFNVQVGGGFTWDVR